MLRCKADHLDLGGGGTGVEGDRKENGDILHSVGLSVCVCVCERERSRGVHLYSRPLRNGDLPHTVLVVVVGLGVPRGQDGPSVGCQHASTRH